MPLSAVRSSLLSTSKDILPKTLPAIDEYDVLPNKRRKSVWSSDIPTYNLNQDCSPSSPSAEASSAKTPLDFFNLFWSENIIEHIVTQSNKYGQQKNINLNLTKGEIYVVLGAMLLSGYTKCPNKRMYWSSFDDVPKMLYNSIRLNRFETVIRHLHFNGNFVNDRTDKLYKLRPIITHLNEEFREHGDWKSIFQLTKSMIPYYGSTTRNSPSRENQLGLTTRIGLFVAIMDIVLLLIFTLVNLRYVKINLGLEEMLLCRF